MGISRRGFLGAILAAAVSPAIVRAASLMKVVPISDTGIVGYVDGLVITPGVAKYDPIFPGFDNGNHTVEVWAKQNGAKSLDSGNWTDPSEWHHVAQTMSGGEIKFYLDGKQVPRELMGPYQNLITHNDGKTFVGGAQMKPFDGYIGEVKVNSGAPDRVPVPDPQKATRTFSITGAQQVNGVSSAVLNAPSMSIPDPAAIATKQLGRLQQALVGRALADVARANNKVGQLIDQWDRPFITTPFDKLEDKS